MGPSERNLVGMAFYPSRLSPSFRDFKCTFTSLQSGRILLQMEGRVFFFLVARKTLMYLTSDAPGSTKHETVTVMTMVTDIATAFFSASSPSTRAEVWGAQVPSSVWKRAGRP